MSKGSFVIAVRLSIMLVFISKKCGRLKISDRRIPGKERQSVDFIQEFRIFLKGQATEKNLSSDKEMVKYTLRVKLV